MKVSEFKKLIREEIRRVLKEQNSNILVEGALLDLIKSIKTFGLANAVLRNAGPPLGTALYNGFKSGAIYKPSENSKDVLYSKDVSWYAPDKVKSLAKQLDDAEKKYEDLHSKLMPVAKTITKELEKSGVDPAKLSGTTTNGNTRTTEIADVVQEHPEFIKLNIDILRAEGTKLWLMNQMQVAMGAKDKQNPRGLEAPIYDERGVPIGVSYEKKDLYKRYPKDWVDDAFTDKPISMSNRFTFLQERIKELESKLQSIQQK